MSSRTSLTGTQNVPCFSDWTTRLLELKSQGTELKTLLIKLFKRCPTMQKGCSSPLWIKRSSAWCLWVLTVHGKGGVEIIVRSEETRVRKWVIYWTGYKQIRDESSSSALKSISIQCDTIRTNTIPSLRDALARLARQMFAGSSDERLQYRTLFGKLRLEASVHDPYYCSAFRSLRQDLSPAYADMFEEDELKRTRAIVKFLSDHCLQV